VVDNEPHKHIVDAAVMNRAMRVGPRAAITDVRMSAMECKLQGNILDAPQMVRASGGHGFSRDADNGIVQVFATFKHEMAFDSEDSREDPPVIISGTWVLSYKVEDLGSFSDEDLGAFAQVNGMFNAYPFWREFLHSTTGRMGIQPFTAPTLRVETGDEKPSDS
jgi:hypothetical protein